jgi:hypothetical protein
LWQFPPRRIHHISRRIQHHVAIHNVAKQWLALVGAYRDEIRTGLGIIVSAQANGFAVMNFRIKSHITFLVIKNNLYVTRRDE